MEYVRLNDGNKIPAIGFGVFMIPNDGPTYEAVLQALKAGHRHIDTAAAYFNEEDVGKAVRDSGIPREEIFITSKLWLQDHGYEAAKKGIARSLRKLDIGYIDACGIIGLNQESPINTGLERFGPFSLTRKAG